ncbi:citrate lyase subunit gamma (acyl carrier protein) [Balneicella halophila]|uniref:Citrate lyase subunit gamma (Acyl carrier protein) n=1 Tax=Balneicella halophila TaxID=1537566 RepID=A0A7L4UME4_BALHA|nr:citrate lyase acyl carrier protein [Balneicella halophila]PVX49401.1 citrate lyase subunit gamma (acyl carrier protein) [Balneicella halophila]
MKLKSQAQAGTLESSDLMVLIKPLEEGKGRVVAIDSSVKMQYQESIEKAIEEVLDELDVKDVQLHVNDKGALTPVIKARVETAIKRSAGTAEGTLVE